MGATDPNVSPNKSRTSEETQETRKKERKSKKKSKELVVDSADRDEPSTECFNTEVTEVIEEKKDKKKKKKHRTTEDEITETPDASQTEEPEKSKSDKKKKRSHAVTDEVAAEEPSKDEPARKKRKKSKKFFADPSGDETLSDQARKALTYAFTQAETPDVWKFNKAKQNWLIRNIWSEQEIPESYLSLSIQYLTGVKGGIWDSLIKACNDLLAEPEAEADSQKAENDADEPSNPQDAKRIRAKLLLKALQKKKAQ
ncbi:hypothetical protein ONZ45_g4566 [Pleurotus djamor]|nr:hypothetical protein ONZ45_g4566 [Pleurotus djamor]